MFQKREGTVDLHFTKQGDFKGAVDEGAKVAFLPVLQYPILRVNCWSHMCNNKVNRSSLSGLIHMFPPKGEHPLPIFPFDSAFFFVNVIEILGLN